MDFDIVLKPAGESPPPYSTVVATAGLSEPPNTALPFANSDRLATKIRALVSEGRMLHSRFQDVRDIASASAKFDHQELSLVLFQRFEKLLWESRDVAGVALVAAKDFNEIILDFLSEPNAVVQDRLKELTNASKMLQRERDSVANHRSSFDTLFKELEDFHRMIYSELGASIPRRRKQSHSGGYGTRGVRPHWKTKPPIKVPRPERTGCFPSITTSLGVISRTCVDYALHIERIAEQAVFPSCVSPAPETQQTGPAASNQNPDTNPNPDSNRNTLLRRKHLRAPSLIAHAELATLPSLVDALVHDLGAFTRHIDIFNTFFSELAREQDIFIVYLKDGQSVSNPGYRSEINRVRRHLPCVCSALDAYSKAKLS